MMSRIRLQLKLPGPGGRAAASRWLDEHAGLPGAPTTTVTIDPVLPSSRARPSSVFWHEYIPFMFYLRGHCDVAMLVSRHRDAEWISQAARSYGIPLDPRLHQPRRG